MFVIFYCKHISFAICRHINGIWSFTCLATMVSSYSSYNRTVIAQPLCYAFILYTNITWNKSHHIFFPNSTSVYHFSTLTSLALVSVPSYKFVCPPVRRTNKTGNVQTRVGLNIVDVEKQWISNILSLFLYSFLSQPACKWREPFESSVTCLALSFFHIISENRQHFRKKKSYSS